MTARILHLLVARRTSGGREIEQGPEWFDRPEVARILRAIEDRWVAEGFPGRERVDELLGEQLQPS